MVGGTCEAMGRQHACLGILPDNWTGGYIPGDNHAWLAWLFLSLDFWLMGIVPGYAVIQWF
jgi:hypothetical protein